ncbi:MAG: hypothetical protein ACM3IJ_04945 [Candidatus Levyibacteriota bacterium]
MPNRQNNLSGEFILKPATAPAVPVATEAPLPAGSPTPLASPALSPKAKAVHSYSKPKFYTSLAYYPEGFTFQDQEADEEVVLLVRRDFITNVPWILSVLLLALVPPVLFFAVPIFFPIIAVTQPLIYLSIVFYYLVLLAFAFMFFTVWYFNVGLVTNRRIIDLDVPNILVKETSEARLSSIADVTLIQVGGLQGFFDYGDIRVLTETYEQHIEFERAPNPNMIRKTIGELLVDKPAT